MESDGTFPKSGALPSRMADEKRFTGMVEFSGVGGGLGSRRRAALAGRGRMDRISRRGTCSERMARTELGQHSLRIVFANAAGAGDQLLSTNRSESSTNRSRGRDFAEIHGSLPGIPRGGCLENGIPPAPPFGGRDCRGVRSVDEWHVIKADFNWRSYLFSEVSKV